MIGITPLCGGLLPNLKTYEDWRHFASVFLTGGLAGVLFTFFISLEIERLAQIIALMSFKAMVGFMTTVAVLILNAGY